MRSIWTDKTNKKGRPGLWRQITRNPNLFWDKLEARVDQNRGAVRRSLSIARRCPALRGADTDEDFERDNGVLDAETDHAVSLDNELCIDTETPLILAVQHILSLAGLVFSTGAIRDLPELTSEKFDPKSAVSALFHVALRPVMAR